MEMIDKVYCPFMDTRINGEPKLGEIRKELAPKMIDKIQMHAVE